MEGLSIIFLLLMMAHFSLASFMLHSIPSNVNFAYVFIGNLSSHALAVYVITGSMFLSLLEFFVHGLINILKVKGIVSVHVQQLLYILCKVVWCIIIASWVGLI